MCKNASTQMYVSDELTHFVGRNDPTDDARFERLCKILRDRTLGTGPGNMRDCPHRKLGGDGDFDDLLDPQMVCFCDIPLQCMAIHRKKYGNFGLAFTKEFMKEKGCNPVYYISKHARCTDHRYQDPDDPRRQVKWRDFFREVFDQWRSSLPVQPDGHLNAAKLLRIDNLNLWYVFGHVKFFDSTLPDDDRCNFYMEREWRIIGSLPFALGDVSRIILPRIYVGRLRDRFPDFPEDRIEPV